MTPTELHLRIKSVEAPDTVDSFSNGFYTLTVEELLLLCRKVQAAAWSDAAEFVFNAPRGKILGTKLRRMAEEMERKA